MKRNLARKFCVGLVVVGLATGGSLVALAQQSDGMAPASLTGLLSYNYGWNGTSWDRVKTVNGSFSMTTAAVSTTAVAGTVVAAGTYQVILGASVTRRSCKIINKGLDVLKVSLAGTPTDPVAVILVAGTSTADGGTFDCGNQSGVTTSNQIAVTSPTAGNAYLVMTQ